MKKNLSKENLAKCFVAGLCAILTGCGSIGLAREAAFESAYENVPEEKVDIYTSVGYGILESIDAEGGTVTVYQLDQKKKMTLSYDGATQVQDRYGSSLVMTQLLPGEIVAMRYNSEAEKAGSIVESSDIWTYDDVTKYSIDEGKGTFQVGSDTYRITGETKVFSGTEEITMNQILKQDVISLRGTDRDILSIIVKKGHGYLDLENDQELIGGWIEVGQTVIQQITEDMLLTVPEGSYTVRLTIDGVDETREVTIARNKETVLDLSDIEVPKPVSGKAVFSVFPEEAGASVYVDGIGVDTTYAVILPFGLHQVTASAAGYDTISEYFNVEGEITTVKLTLSEEKKSDSTVSENSLNESDEESYHTITVLEPADVEVYQDNVYMGISPVTYEKKAGSHTITLRRAGYVTKSYQVQVEDDDRDITYTFADLVPDDVQTVSGNSLASPTPSSTVSENKLEETPSPTPTKTPRHRRPHATPSESPEQTPSVTPTTEPTQTPTEEPMQTPTAVPTETPTVVPTLVPTESPAETPDATPAVKPTEIPAVTPTTEPELPPSEQG
ncbi:MAG: PEGA domain-containing protein [Lachnospiraceae bacterium]|nr:PEGA domain-containing protein [Lachnospiraceae bacterium]